MINSIKYAVETEHMYHVEQTSTKKHIYLLLHGYQLDGNYMMRTFKPHLFGKVIAPNGPFVVPTLKKDSYVPKFAWYFFDPKTRNYYISMDPAAKYLAFILEKENPNHYPVTIIGYSQGGYLAPKVAELIPEAIDIIGLACTFRSNKFTARKDISYWQINSQSDLVIDYQEAMLEFQKIAGNAGQFYSLKNNGHKIDEDYLKILKEITIR